MRSIIKSLLTSLCQREEILLFSIMPSTQTPPLEVRGGRGSYVAGEGLGEIVR